jgi:hypothetical protein
MSLSLPHSYELPLEVYKLLVALFEHEEQMSWNRTQAFMVINGVMITALGVIRPTQSTTTNVPLPTSMTSTPKELFVAICVIGALISFLWFTTILRSEAFYNHWIDQLKYIEKEYLAPIKTFQLADDYFAKGEVVLGEEKFKLPKVAKVIHIYQVLVLTSVSFLIIWSVLALYLIF